MAKVDPQNVPSSEGSPYPAPFDQPCRGRRTERLGTALGLTQFGVNMMTIEPGAWSSQRHWHSHEDEFVYVVEGELTLVEDDGETVLRPGDSAGWAAGDRNGHHLRNDSEKPARFLAVGTRFDEDHGEYSDIDMTFGPSRYSTGSGNFRHKDGTPYE